ncbi:MAG: SOS response-associated peptidase family protein [Chitinophagaceae bacterium]
MCYDISFTTSIELITDYLPDIVVDTQIAFDFNAAVHVLAQSYSKYPIIIFEDGDYKLKEYEWGIIADYMNTPEKIKKGRQWMCNAQSEKIVQDKKSYWNRIRRKRCLIPVTGTFEHREIRGWKNKVPYMVRIRDRELFCLPGLFHYSPIPDLETGEARGTFTLVTRAANSIMKQIHNGGTNAFRMPLFLKNKEMELTWLLPDLSDEELAGILDFELPSEALEHWPVYTIRSPKGRPDENSKIHPWSWENLPPLGSDDGPRPAATLF